MQNKLDECPGPAESNSLPSHRREEKSQAADIIKVPGGKKYKLSELSHGQVLYRSRLVIKCVIDPKSGTKAFRVCGTLPELAEASQNNTEVNPSTSESVCPS